MPPQLPMPGRIACNAKTQVRIFIAGYLVGADNVEGLTRFGSRGQIVPSDMMIAFVVSRCGKCTHRWFITSDDGDGADYLAKMFHNASWVTRPSR